VVISTQEGASERLSISWDVPSFKQDYGRNVPESTDASTGVDATSHSVQHGDSPAVLLAHSLDRDASPCSMGPPHSQQTSRAGEIECSGQGVTPVKACLRLDAGSVMLQTTPNSSPGATLSLYKRWLCCQFVHRVHAAIHLDPNISVGYIRARKCCMMSGSHTGTTPELQSVKIPQ
jgi:hypothetical protein